MITKLPHWVKYGAFLLALLAGIVNVIGLLSFQHQAVSHLSGTITLLGASLEALNTQTSHLLLVLISFLIGTIISGFFIESTALQLGRKYGVALCMEGFLLLGAYWLLNKNYLMGQYLASTACGLQNAMITTFSGAIIRTTHMTGIITDLGLMIGARLRGKPFDHKKAALFMFIFCGFLSGSFIGAKVFAIYSIAGLLLPVALTFIFAIAYWRFILNTAIRAC